MPHARLDAHCARDLPPTAIASLPTYSLVPKGPRFYCNTSILYMQQHPYAAIVRSVPHAHSTQRMEGKPSLGRKGVMQDLDRVIKHLCREALCSGVYARCCRENLAHQSCCKIGSKQRWRTTTLTCRQQRLPCLTVNADPALHMFPWPVALYCIQCTKKTAAI